MFLVKNRKKLMQARNSTYFNYFMYQISAYTDNSGFLDQISTKRVYLVKFGKKWTTIEFCIFDFSRYQTSA